MPGRTLMPPLPPCLGLAVQGGFRSGLPDGKATVWHPNGLKAKESSWREGEQLGVERASWRGTRGGGTCHGGFPAS
jgi:hypothetical protein